MDFTYSDDDEIGNFGLLPSFHPKKKKKKKASTNNATTRRRVKNEKIQKNIANNNCRYNGNLSNKVGRSKSINATTMAAASLLEDDISSSSSSDDEIALSELAKPKNCRLTVVTPAPPPTQSMTSHHHVKSQQPQQQQQQKKQKQRSQVESSSSSSEQQHDSSSQQSQKKMERTSRQLGLHSFLQTTHSSKPRQQQKQKQKQQRRKTPMQAESLAAATTAAEEEEESRENHYIHNENDGNKNLHEEKVVSSTITKSSSTNSNNNYATEDQLIDSSSDDDDNDKIDHDKSDNNNSLQQRRKKLSSSLLGIHSLIMGQNLPTMHPDEYHRAINSSNNSSSQKGNVNNNNILSHLLQRSYSPKMTLSSNVLSRYIHSSSSNDVNRYCTEHVQLSSNNNNNNNNNNNSETTTMSFDNDGILLATGTTHGNIHIYDFDEVYAAELKHRNLWSKHCFEWRVAAETVGGDDDAAAADDGGCTSSLELKDGDDCNDGKVEEDCVVSSERLEEGSNILNNNKSTPQQPPPPPPPPPLPPITVNPVLTFPCQFINRNNTRTNNNNNNSPRISGIHWNPNNQDILAVSFANKSEVHLYDVASSLVPQPCLRVGGESSSSSSLSRGGLGNHHHQQQQRCEGVMSMRFISSSSFTTDEERMSTTSHMQIITGGAYGTVRLWSIPPLKKQGGKRRRRCCISELNAKCIWSIPVFAKGEGVCDMLLLPAPKATTTSPAITSSSTTTTTTKKPLVLLSGSSSSTLVLLDTNKCTRKAFSTSVTPTVVASWNLHQLASLELTKIDKKAQLPERRWISASNMRLIEYRQLRNENEGGGSWWCKIGIVSRCGWVFVAELGCRNNNIPRLSIHIIHHTPRIQCFNSSNERLTTLGGMALQFSLPSSPVASSNCIRMSSNNMIWLSNVNAKKYTLPSKDKYVLCEDYDTLEVMEEDELVTPGRITSSSDSGMILVNLDEGKEYYDGFVSRNTVTRLPLPMTSNPPLALATHPSGEWMVIGCGGRGDSSELKLISMRGHTL